MQKLGRGCQIFDAGNFPRCRLKMPSRSCFRSSRSAISDSGNLVPTICSFLVILSPLLLCAVVRWSPPLTTRLLLQVRVAQLQIPAYSLNQPSKLLIKRHPYLNIPHSLWQLTHEHMLTLFSFVFIMNSGFSSTYETVLKGGAQASAFLIPSQFK